MFNEDMNDTATAKCEIVRILTGHAYPKSGNAHNPTPRYRWDVTYKGRRVGSSATAKGAKLLAAEFESAPEW